MKLFVRIFNGMSLAAVLILAGCGTAQIEKGQAVTLQANEGIAAIVVDSLDPLSDLQFQSQDDSGQKIRIPVIDRGINLFIFVVPAGTYCDSSFFYGNWKFTPTGRQNATCFDVLPGKIAYSGNLSPRADVGTNVKIGQVYTWPQFESQMKRDYPDLVAKYPIVTP